MLAKRVSTPAPHVAWTGPRCNCDICQADISTTEFFDAKTVQGAWGLLCLDCFMRFGVGLGTGRGQKYNAKGEKVGG